MMLQTELEIELADVIRSRWGDNGIEYLIGAMSTIATPEQLTALLDANR
jgi:hypothetical protein